MFYRPQSLEPVSVQPTTQQRREQLIWLAENAPPIGKVLSRREALARTLMTNAC